MKRIIYSLFILSVLATGCKRTDFDLNPTGEGLGNFSITGPANGTVLALNSATPNSAVEITWTAAKPGLNTAPKYFWIAALRNGGNLDQPILEYPSDNGGTATKLTLTQKQIDDFLRVRNVPEGAALELVWTIVADNGDTRIKSTDQFFITLRRFADGATPFLLLGPPNAGGTIEISPSSTTDSVRFVWQSSKPGKVANAVTYRIQFDRLDGNFSAPILNAASNNTGRDTVKTWSFKDFSDALTAAGFTDLSAVVNLKWRVVATSGNFNLPSTFENQVAYLREVKIYLVGGSTPIGWNPGDALQMIPDEKFPGAYYIYVRLTQDGGGFKFLNQREWPNGPLNSTDWGMKPGTPGDLAADGEDNINVSADGVYRVTFDSRNLKYYVQSEHGRMATVGGGTPAGWNPPNVFPSQALSLIAPNKFLGLVEFVGGDAFKMIDGNFWPDGGGPITQSKDFGTGASGNAMREQGEGNFNGPATAGRYRVVWNGTDVKNLTYEITPASEMRIVGNALTNFPEWTPMSSPQMTYEGNGVWTITIELKGSGEFKFLAANDWGALDYEDAGGGKIKYDGGPNFTAPSTAGTYKITLDEHKATYSIQAL